MSSPKTTERLVSRSLHEIADHLEVTSRDLDRLEDAWRDSTRRRPSGLGGRRLVAASVVLVALLTGVVLLVTSPRDTTPAPSVTVTTTSVVGAAELRGLWRVDGDNAPTLWAIAEGGSMRLVREPDDVIDTEGALALRWSYAAGTFTATAPSLCSRSWKVSRGATGVVLDEVSKSGECPSVFDRWWVHSTLTRVAPATERALAPKYQGGARTTVADLSELTGTWLPELGGTVLAIREATPGTGRTSWVMTERADALASPEARKLDETGTVEVRPDGSVAFSLGASGFCERIYDDVRTDYATLELRLSPTSCMNGFGGTPETWVRLN